MAATFGWTARYIERELTDELLVMYLDEEVDRLRNRTQADFDSLVEAVRAGTIFAHNKKAHDKYIASSAAKQKRPSLTGAALEAAVMNIAKMFPDNVTVVPA
jgi:hypothetical protein